MTKLETQLFKNIEIKRAIKNYRIFYSIVFAPLIFVGFFSVFFSQELTDFGKKTIIDNVVVEFRYFIVGLYILVMLILALTIIIFHNLKRFNETISKNNQMSINEENRIEKIEDLKTEIQILKLKLDFSNFALDIFSKFVKSPLNLPNEFENYKKIGDKNEN